MKARKLLTLTVCIAIPLLIGFVSGYATSSNISSWYSYLKKPDFNPPNWIFGPVWSTLYVLMGVSHYRVQNSPPSKLKSAAVTVYFVQLALNFSWSFIFFYFHQTGWALVEIGILWLSIVLMISLFSRINRTAAYLQVPYLAWVSFATALNACIWYLNK